MVAGSKSGTVWYPALLPVLFTVPELRPQSQDETSVLGVTGFIYEDHCGDLIPISTEHLATVENQRTGIKIDVNINTETGEFSGAFVDLSGSNPTRTGDLLEMVVMDTASVPLGDPTYYTVTGEDVDRKYAVFNAIIPGSGAGLKDHTIGGWVLYQNEPNPFTTLTRILYSLVEQAPTSVKIYDSRGRLINVLTDEPLGPGDYSVVWTGRDQSRRLVSPGVYYCRMRVSGHEAVQKLVFLE
jgi:hypothetical protein